MATITKLPSGKFRAQIRRQGVYRAQTFSRKLDAQVWAAELERAIESGSSRGTIQPSAGMLLSDLIEAYTRQAKVSRAAELALLQIGRSIGQTPVRQLNALHVFDWIQQRQGDGLKTASILRSLGRFSRLLQWARDIKNIDIDAGIVLEARHKLVRRNPTPSRHRDRIPTPAELARLQEHFSQAYAGSLPLCDLMNFALASAMRLGEICRISFEDVDWERHTVVVRDRKDPKYKIGNHQTIPLLPDAMAIVEARRNGMPPQGRIFPVRAETVSATWFNTTRRLGIEDLTFHDLRHAAITDLFRKGLGIPEVALISGHRSWRELKRYTQLTAQDVLAKLRQLRDSGE